MGGQGQVYDCCITDFEMNFRDWDGRG